jgi:hypothetical protein
MGSSYPTLLAPKTRDQDGAPGVLAGERVLSIHGPQSMGKRALLSAALWLRSGNL